MRFPLYHRSSMRHSAIPRRFMVPSDFELPRPSSTTKSGPQTVYDAWLTSREMPGKTGMYLVPGAPRALTLQNTWLAIFVCQTCILDFVRLFSALYRQINLTIFLAVQSPMDAQSSKDNSNDGIEHCSKPFPGFSGLFSGSSHTHTHPIYLIT